MAKKIKERVAESLKDSPHEDVTKYLEWLRASIEALSQNLRRTIALALLLIAAFELINGSPSAVIIISSFKISSGSIVAIFIPAMVSFLLYQATADTNRLATLQDAFTNVFSMWSSEAERNDLDLWVLPSQPVYWNVSMGESRTNRTRRGAMQFRLEGIITGFVFTTVITFQIQAYSVLYSTASHYKALWVVSISIAAFCSIAAIIVFIGFIMEWW